ncbi:MAG: Cdc6/Cdc18 family protein [Halococcoides sp.]
MASAPTESPFADRSLLDPDAIPPAFDHRDATREALRTVLSPALWGSGPATALIAGPPGAGKRTAVAVTVDRAERPGDRPGPTLVPVACEPETTGYELAIAATNTLVGDGVLATSGYTRETAFRRLRHWITQAAGPPVFRLDGADRLDPAELEVFLGVLFEESVACGVVAVADDASIRERFPRGVLDRFHGEIGVPPYDEATERAILADRAEHAFEAGACPDETIDRALGLSDERGLRTALELLDAAGDLARAAGADVVDPTHVDRADRDLRAERLRERIEDCSRHERLVLGAVLDGEGEHRFADILERYRDRCAAVDVDPNRKRSVHNYLDALVEAGLLAAERRRSADAGTHFAYRPGVDRDALEGVLDAVNRSERR